MDTCLYMAESLHRSPETITTLLISSTPNIKLKVKKIKYAQKKRYISKIITSPTFLEHIMTNEKGWEIKLDKATKSTPQRAFNNMERSYHHMLEVTETPNEPCAGKRSLQLGHTGESREAYPKGPAQVSSRIHGMLRQAGVSPAQNRNVSK